MRVDIYKRAETGGHTSYLAVPEGALIPDEATNVDWEDAARGVELDEETDALPEYAIEDPVEQITSKGYAITSLRYWSEENGAGPH